MLMSHHHHRDLPNPRRLQHPPGPPVPILNTVTLAINHASNHSSSRISSQVPIKFQVVLHAGPLAALLTMFAMMCF